MSLPGFECDLHEGFTYDHHRPCIQCIEYPPEEVSVLFIPFDASSLEYYHGNAGKGVWGSEGFLGNDVSWDFGESAAEVKKKQRKKKSKAKTNIDASILAKSSFFLRGKDHEFNENNFLKGRGIFVRPGEGMERKDIIPSIPKIVAQECELIRQLYSQDSGHLESLTSWAESQRGQPVTPGDLGYRRMHARLKGFKFYPDIIFLSEEPGEGGMGFPPVINTGLPLIRYIKQAQTPRWNEEDEYIRSVNQIAVYLRSDIDARVNDPTDDTFFEATYIFRNPRRKGFKLHQPTKLEHMLKVTLGRRGRYSVTVAGVHLRSSLTNIKDADMEEMRDREMAALRDYCRDSGIQLMVGDFNLDLQAAPDRGRGLYFGGQQEHRPVFMIDQANPSADIRYYNQYSSASSTKHYMGYFQADVANLQLIGPSAYGRMGASLSRTLEGKFYSDHPSIYLCARSTAAAPFDKKKSTAIILYDKSQFNFIPMTDSDKRKIDNDDGPSPKRQRIKGNQEDEKKSDNNKKRKNDDDKDPRAKKQKLGHNR